MKYCILGGGGSFGLHTAHYLLTAADSVHKVIGIGRAAPKAECFTLGVGNNDARYAYLSFHVTYEHDLLLDFLDREQPEIIINFAAQGEGATSLRHSWRYFETNCVGLSRLVEALSKRTYLKRFVHVGTSELYGSTARPAKETDPIRPTSPYAASKAAFDMYLLSIHKHLGFPMNIVRPSNAYGEGQQLHRVIPKAVLFGLTGKRLPLHGGGMAEKSYIHSWDLARAIHLVSMFAPEGAVYNIGPDQPIKIKDVVAMVARKLNLGFDELAEVVGDREHQDARYWLDSSAILHAVGWQPLIDWDAGLGRMVDWGRKYLPQLRALPVDFVMRA